MRRSAAPSQLSAKAKRPRFNPHQGTSGFQTPTYERSKEDVIKLIKGGKEVENCSSQASCTGKSPEECVHNPKLSSRNSGVNNPEEKKPTKKLFMVPNKPFRSPNQSQNTTQNSPNVAEQIDDMPNLAIPDDKISKYSLAEHTEVEKPSFSKDLTMKPVTKFLPPSTVRAPLRPKSMQGSQSNTDDEPKTYYYNIVWCKHSKKKHKKWEGDAILQAKGRIVTIIDTEGKEIGKGSGYKVSELSTMTEGNTLVVGGKEIEVMSLLKEEDFVTGKCFQTATMVTNKASLLKLNSVVSKPFARPQLSGGSLQNAQMQPSTPINVRPKFDPTAPNALVMPQPGKNHQWEHNRQGLQIVDVVVDPHVAYHLRPHQRTGVVFLYECVMGMKDFTGQGAILADEMGLGKTLQCISLIWTLHKQGPYGGKPVVRRVLVITPGSLVKNWAQEFKKWLGSERLKVFTVGSENKAEDFARCKVYPVMIISYEMFIRNIDTIKTINFDLVICDEGHRLKNTNIKTTAFMMSLATRRRVVLTGTPLQNDLRELFSIVEFCNPGVLGTSSAFHNVYEAPILASRQPNATPSEEALGEVRAQELNRVTSMFILRRTQDINNKYLPPKVEMVLFCRPSELQLQLYRKLLSSRAVVSCLASGDSAQHLMCIAAMKKISNCPSLLYRHAVEAGEKKEVYDPYCNEEPELYSGLIPVYPPCYDPEELELEHSGKLKVVCELLQVIHNEPLRQRVVLVSNYTQTLDVLQSLCQASSYKFLRLDGQTPTAKRHQLVEQFNSKHSDIFVFLLSSKAGGVGLNLVGASRLILYDIDWNPANDLQAMARIWRDGQKEQVFIYRLITTGSIEEKMYQRQVSKQGLSGVIVDAKANSKLKFSPDDLKDLFRVHEDSLCCTHDLLGCECDQEDPHMQAVDHKTQTGYQPRTARQSCTQKNICMDELLQWTHKKGPAPDLSHVDSLLVDCAMEDVTYAFWNMSGQSQKL